jgi:protein gp37
MNETAIAWTELTWNPMSGCQKVSPGCRFCYAETLAENKRGTAAFPQGFDLTIRPHKLGEPYKVKAPSRIFVNSMSDLFWDRIPEEYRRKILAVIEANPRHTFQILTKRAEAMELYFQTCPVPPNVWLGVSVESEDQLGRVECLRRIDAPLRFISAEPLLTPLSGLDLAGIGWLISGGESGAHLCKPAIREARSLASYSQGKWAPREDRMDWVRELRDKCLACGCAFFHKQWGGYTGHSAGNVLDGVVWEQFPELARV